MLKKLKAGYPQCGFTLLELAIVLVVISMIAGGVLAGREILKSSKLKSVTDDLGTINRAVQDFQKLYGGLPGDLYDAPTKLGNNAALRGNGNGVLEANNNYGDNEIRGFWQHLALSGLLPGNFNGASDAPGIGTKAGKLPQSGFYVRTNPTSNELEISFSRFTAGASGASVLTPDQAWDVDRKHDDGNPTTGFIRATEGSDAAANGCVNGGAYNVSNLNTTCVITTRAQNTGKSVADNARTSASIVAGGCPGGDGGVANTAVGGFRTCTCATSMVGVCREQCMAGGTWEYDLATSTCAYPPCNPTVTADQRYTLTAASTGATTYADFTGLVLADGTASPGGTPLGALARGTCNTAAGYIGYIGTWPPDGVTNRFDSAYPQLKCTPPGGTSGFHINSASNPIVGTCELGQCNDAAMDPNPPSGHTVNAGLPLLMVGNPARTLACPASGFSSGTFQVNCILSPSPVLNVVSSSCVPRSCTALVYTIPGYPTKSVTLPATAHNTTRVVACPAGMSGNVSGNCRWGSYTSHGPITDTCTPNPCPNTFCYPGHPTRCITMPGPLTHGTVSTGLACPTGMTGTWEATCSFGAWTQTGGSCTPDSCGAVVHGGSQSQSCSPSCSCGVSSNGSHSRVCSYGTWGGWGACSGGSCNSCAPPCTDQCGAGGGDYCWDASRDLACGYRGGCWILFGDAARCGHSDRRLKKDIILVGKQNGINIYTFRYKNDPQNAVYRGVIAQEVEHLPGVVSFDAEGYRVVDYWQLGIPFERLTQ